MIPSAPTRMVFATVFAVAAGFAVGAVSALAAQRGGVGTGSLIPGRSSGMVSSGLSDATAMDLRSGPTGARMSFYRRAASCAVAADAEKVRRYLDAVFGGDYTSDNWRDFRAVYEDCLDSTRGNDKSFEVPGDGRYLWLAAVNAEAYLRAVPAAQLAATPIATLYQDAAFQSLPTGGVKTVRCMVHVEPAKSLAVIATAAGSQDEGRAIAALIPTIGKCTDNGATIALKRDMLRLNIAPAYYVAAMKRERQTASRAN